MQMWEGQIELLAASSAKASIAMTYKFEPRLNSNNKNDTVPKQIPMTLLGLKKNVLVSWFVQYSIEKKLQKLI